VFKKRVDVALWDMV